MKPAASERGWTVASCRRTEAATHEELKRLVSELHTTVGDKVTLAVRALRQDRVGAELSTPLRSEETAWLNAELG